LSISSISSSPYGAGLQQFQSAAQQRRTDFNNLAKALQSGDLSGAQQAFSDLTQTGRSTAGNSNNPISKDFAALGDALKSGDLSQAQDAFTKLKQDLQATQQNGQAGGAHHAHRGQRAPTNDGDGATQNATINSSNASGSTPTTGTTINLLG
jgi:hypothetical protein